MKKRNNFQIGLRLISLVKPLTGFMVLAIVLGVLGHLCATFITIFGGYSILALLNVDVPLTLAMAFIGITIFAIMRGIFHYGEQSFNHYIAFKILALIRDKIFLALRRLCPGKLEGKDKGNLISLITADIELLEVFYAHTISPIVIAGLMSLFMCLFIGSYHWLLGIIAGLAYLSVGILIPLLTFKFNGQDGLKFRSKSGELSSFVLESLRGLSETLQYQGGQLQLEEIERKTDALALDEEKMKLRGGLNIGSTNTVILLFNVAMILTAIFIFEKGVIGFDGVLIPVIAMISSFGPVIALANLGSTLQNTFAAGNRVLDILDETPQVEDIKGKPEILFSGAKTKKLTFSYGGEPILSDATVEFPENTVIGIVGKSGSGKSTLLKLLMRFWNPQKGEINISGRNINEINTNNLRELQSYVTQETHLFHDSIKNNLRIAKLDASSEEIEEACKKASVHDFIMTLPKAYDTMINELGDSLSGGERQRIGLARAFLHDAPFLLLDEPTSNLDSLNEGAILKSINEERGNKTVVLISHRQSTMGIADKVYTAEYGRTS